VVENHVLPYAPRRQHSNGRESIAVVGAGYVGLVTAACLAELGNSVLCVDNDAAKIAVLRGGVIPFYEPGLDEIVEAARRGRRLEFTQDVAAGVRRCSVVVIAVGTPKGRDGEADLSAVYSVAATVGRELNGPKTVIVKSTVPVKTCEKIAAVIAENAATGDRVDVVSNPEFLREGVAVADFMHPDRIVVGTDDPRAEAVVRKLYAALGAPFVVTDARTSEMIKYAANAFLATKVSFMNEIANICDAVDADVRAVGLGLSLDPRIGSAFMRPGIGYGGSCFPKDVPALLRAAGEHDYDATLLRSVDAVNARQVSRATASLERALGGSLLGKNVGVLGLTFKPNTSDVRESPAIRLVECLLERGANVAVHDPVAIEEARRALGERVAYCGDLYEAACGADAVALATEWDDYLDVDFSRLRALMRGDVLFDGRNALDSGAIAAEGLRYVGVGYSEAPMHGRTGRASTARG